MSEFISPLELGIVSQIVGNTYTVLHTNNADLLGEQFSLDMTYCSIVMNAPSDHVMAIQQFSVSPYLRHPAYKVFKLETYIGMPIQVKGKRFGTINFTKPEVRSEPFSDEEKAFVRCLSAAIGDVLSQ